MNAYLAQDFRDFALTLVAMLALVILLPRWLIPAETLSQRAVAAAILATSALALLVGGVIVFLQYARLNPGEGTLLLRQPLGRAGFFLGRSALIAMFWAPLLGFVWLRQAQAVEARRGEKVVGESLNSYDDIGIIQLSNPEHRS